MENKKNVLLFFFLLLNLYAFSQPGQTRSQIISEYGYKYENGITKDGDKYITYKLEDNQIYTFYFITQPNVVEICDTWKIMEPSSHANSMIKMVQNFGFVQLSETLWKDYSMNTLYSISIVENVCLLTIWFDDKK